jgi:long-subunit acyl-CoA synthetase (AMP-forming)
VNTGCKLIIVDPERADRLETVVAELAKDAGANGFLVIDSHEGKGLWKGMRNCHDMIANFRGDPNEILKQDPFIVPEDNATIIFTSGTTGLPKGVLSSQRMFLTNVLNVGLLHLFYFLKTFLIIA